MTISLIIFLNMIAQKIEDPLGKSILGQGIVAYEIFEHLRRNIKKYSN